MTLVMAASLIQSVLHPSTGSETKLQEQGWKDKLIITAYRPSASPKLTLCGSAWVRPPTLQCWVRPLENAQKALKPKHQQEKMIMTFLGGRSRYTAAPGALRTTKQTPLHSFQLPQCIVLWQLQVIQRSKHQCRPFPQGLQEPSCARCCTNTTWGKSPPSPKQESSYL